MKKSICKNNERSFESLSESDDGWTPSAKPSAGSSKKHGDRRDRRTFTSHNTPVLYAPSRREVRAGQRLYILVRQSSLYERLPIRKLPQPGLYTGPYYTNAHDQRERKRRGGPRSCPNPLSCHLPGCFPPRCIVVLTQNPPKRRGVACPIGARRQCPRQPSAHRDCRTRPLRTSSRREQQNKFKLAHDQRTVKLRYPVRPLTNTDMSHWWQVMERVTANRIMSRGLKNQPQARPTRRNLQDTSANWRKCTRLQRVSLSK